MIQEFKRFMMRGNILDIAIGVIIGTAFDKLVSSLVNDMIMPPIGLLIGKVDFSSLYLNLSRKHYPSLQDAQEAGAATVNYGLFINQVLDFIIIAAAAFFIVKELEILRNRHHQKTNTKEEQQMEEQECPYCRSKIDPRAIRCPSCTSRIIQVHFLSKNEGKTKDKKKHKI